MRTSLIAILLLLLYCNTTVLAAPRITSTPKLYDNIVLPPHTTPTPTPTLTLTPTRPSSSSDIESSVLKSSESSDSVLSISSTTDTAMTTAVDSFSMTSSTAIVSPPTNPGSAPQEDHTKIVVATVVPAVVVILAASVLVWRRMVVRKTQVRESSDFKMLESGTALQPRRSASLESQVPLNLAKAAMAKKPSSSNMAQIIVLPPAHLEKQRQHQYQHEKQKQEGEGEEEEEEDEYEYQQQQQQQQQRSAAVQPAPVDSWDRYLIELHKVKNASEEAHGGRKDAGSS